MSDPIRINSHVRIVRKDPAGHECGEIEATLFVLTSPWARDILGCDCEDPPMHRHAICGPCGAQWVELFPAAITDGSDAELVNVRARPDGFAGIMPLTFYRARIVIVHRPSFAEGYDDGW